MSFGSRSFLPLAVLLACGPERTDTINTTSITDPSDTAGSSGPEPTGGAGECAPGPVDGVRECVESSGTRAVWQISGISSYVFDQTCTVDGLDDDGTLQTLSLTCPDGAIDIELWTIAPHVSLDLAMGATVRLRNDAGYDGEKPVDSFILRDDADQVLAAGVDGPLLPLDFGDLKFDESSTTCEGIGDDCVITQRAAVVVTAGDSDVAVFDGNTGTVAGLTVLVDFAHRLICYGESDEMPCGFNYSPFSTTALVLRGG